MREKQKQILLVGGTSFLILAVLVILFFQLVMPHIQAQEEAGQQLEEEKIYIGQMERQVQAEQEEAEAHPETSTEQQRRLPVVRLTDQFLLDLSMAEELSGARILDLDMTYEHPVYRYETVDITPLEDLPEDGEDIDEVREEEEALDQENENDSVTEEPANEANTDGNNNEDNNEEIATSSDLEERDAETDGEPQAGALQGEAIEGMRKQTAVIELEVNNYASLYLFLEELDGLLRYVNIESVLFLGEEEDRIFDGETDIFFEVHVSSFYYPELEELEFEAPIADYPQDEINTEPFLN